MRISLPKSTKRRQKAYCVFIEISINNIRQIVSLLNISRRFFFVIKTSYSWYREEYTLLCKSGANRNTAVNRSIFPLRSARVSMGLKIPRDLERSGRGARTLESNVPRQQPRNPTKFRVILIVARRNRLVEHEGLSSRLRPLTLPRDYQPVITCYRRAL